MTGQTINAAPAPAPEAVTVHEPLVTGRDELFAVQPGVPLADAMRVLETLLYVLADMTALSARTKEDKPGALWSVDYLLSMASGLQTSIHSGFLEYQKQVAEAGKG